MVSGSHLVFVRVPYNLVVCACGALSHHKMSLKLSTKFYITQLFDLKNGNTFSLIVSGKYVCTIKRKDYDLFSVIP
jgi:hypothetical protein